MGKGGGTVERSMVGGRAALLAGIQRGQGGAAGTAAVPTSPLLPPPAPPQWGIVFSAGFDIAFNVPRVAEEVVGDVPRLPSLPSLPSSSPSLCADPTSSSLSSSQLRPLRRTGLTGTPCFASTAPVTIRTPRIPVKLFIVVAAGSIVVPPLGFEAMTKRGRRTQQ